MKGMFKTVNGIVKSMKKRHLLCANGVQKYYVLPCFGAFTSLANYSKGFYLATNAANK